MRKANQFVFSQHGNFQFLNLMSFPGGATTFEALLFSKQTKPAKPGESFFRWEKFENVKVLMYQPPPWIDDFLSRVRKCNLLDKTHFLYQNTLITGFNTTESFEKLKLSVNLPMGHQNSPYSPDVWNTNNIYPFRDFLHYTTKRTWYHLQGRERRKYILMPS